MDGNVTHFGLEACNAAYRLWETSERGSPESEEAAQILKRWKQRKERQDEFLARRGRRYADARFETFIVSNDTQQRVVDALRDYAANAVANLKAGKNVLLVGPRGTGKDHLLTALAKEVFNTCEAITKWENGCDLVSTWRRQAIGEASDWPDYYGPDSNVLFISDLLPPAEPLSAYCQAKAFKLIDKRYSDRSPLWLSLNVASAAELNQRLGAQSADRLRHDALVLQCNWPSYRTEATKQGG
jgi:DNA replication protein DnaC